MKNNAAALFKKEAEQVLNLKVAAKVNELGGYGANGEVIYDKQPDGCPSVLVTTAGAAKATFISNGSVAFETKLAGGMDVHVLRGHFDPTEKREIGIPSNNLWLRVAEKNGKATIANLLNPGTGIGNKARRIRIVKLGDPDRAMWYCSEHALGAGVSVETAVKFQLVETPAGPALLRLTYLRNTGRKVLDADLWSYFNLHGTQRFVYNKEIWYDAGITLSPTETVISAPVPYSDIVQPKRVSAVAAAGLRAAEATCDYTAFVGDSADSVHMPAAVREGRLRQGAGSKFSRFSIATIAANRFAVKLAPGASTCLLQELLYVSDKGLCDRFRVKTGCRFSDFERIAKAFSTGAADLVQRTPDVEATLALAAKSRKAAPPPAFAVDMVNEPVLSNYAKSLWTGVAELYENCRAHGAKMAQGIELGTRDRGQDMWPKLKEDPARIRADLVHALSFKYVTVDNEKEFSKPVLSRVAKLHGMFPRQFPSRWDDRKEPVRNDNRPYNDSAVWLADSLNMYIRETGDLSILNERVKTVRLTQPDDPENSGIVGCDQSLLISEVLTEIFQAYGRHVFDSPYGLVQIMYGDWCDPIDMFGTSVIGDVTTRGVGRGVQVRLSAHVFCSLVTTIDLFETPKVAALLPASVKKAVPFFKKMANHIRANALRFAWEEGAYPGFITAIHELDLKGKKPNYAAGKIGYTLGSMLGKDFDGAKRRDITAQAYGLQMLRLERDWLEKVPTCEKKVAAIFKSCDKLMFDNKLGLRLFNPPIANNETACRLVGRMGVVPAGCAENGEYHHGQMMMHRFRVLVPGEADNAWKQFKPMVSAMRDTSLAGPFEMPSTSYASDEKDPHFGKGMYFGLSGSTDWIVEFLQHIAGVELALHDDRQPAVRVTPRLPQALGGKLTFRRIVHAAKTGGGYHRIPLTLEINTTGKKESVVKINGKLVPSAEVQSLDGLSKLDIQIG